MDINTVADKMVRVYHEIQDCVRHDIPCDELREEYDRLNREWNRLYKISFS